MRFRLILTDIGSIVRYHVLVVVDSCVRNGLGSERGDNKQTLEWEQGRAGGREGGRGRVCVQVT